MDNNSLIAILFKLHERVNNNDRQRLHSFLGDNILKKLQEDSSFCSNLFLILSLWDQENLNEENMISLINALNQIHCTDMAQYLKQHMKQLQLNGLNSLTENLIRLLPLTKTPSNKENICIEKMNYYRNPKPFTVVLGGQGKTSLRSKRKLLFEKMFTTRRTFWLLSIIPLTLVMSILFGGCLMIFELKMKCNHIRDEQAKNNEIIQNLKFIQSINQENNQLLKDIQSINGENNQDLNMIPLNYDETTQESEITQLITEEDNQPINTTQSNDYETTTALPINEFDEEDQKFTEGSTCGCQQWCTKNGSSYGVCGNGHTCICGHNPILKENIGSGCTCNGWCTRQGYENGGICGDGFTCICSK